MNPMTPTEDIRAARHKLSTEFANNLDQIVADLRRKQRESGREYVVLEPRRPVATRPSRSSGTAGQVGR